jgi:hypothetical protein
MKQGRMLCTQIKFCGVHRFCEYIKVGTLQLQLTNHYCLLTVKNSLFFRRFVSLLTRLEFSGSQSKYNVGPN